MWTRMRLPAAAILVAAAMAGSAGAQDWAMVPPEEVGMSSERLQRLTDYMQGYIDDGDVAGMVILIAKDGKVPYRKAFGYRDLDAKAPMAEDTVFRIASQTKAIVSAGVMILQEEGALLVDEPLGKYLPEWMETSVAIPIEGDDNGFYEVPAERPITVRDLLTHMSGIPYGGWNNDLTGETWTEAGFPGWYLADKNEPIREVVRKMAALPMNAQPGTEWIYGYNVDILGALIEEVSGQPLDEFLSERIFGPLEMEDTQFFLPESEKDRLATVYVRNGEGDLSRASDAGEMWTQGQYVIGQGPNATFSGGAGLLSTADDYATFLEMIRKGGLDVDGDRILSPMSVKLMTTDHTGEVEFRPGAGFGYGFQVALDQGVLGIPGHEGEFRWGGAYHSTYWVDPEEDMVVTAFTQFGETAGLDDQAKLRTLIYQAIMD